MDTIVKFYIKRVKFKKSTTTNPLSNVGLSAGMVTYIFTFQREC